jgi:hypothetical protein
MWLIQRWHCHNCNRHAEELEHLLHLARQDTHH